jgi:hypothetical protein
VWSAGLFEGIFYPRTRFSFIQNGDVPPSSAEKRLEMGDRYPEAVTFLFSQAGNSFEAYFVPTIFVKKPYKEFRLYEMRFEYDGNNDVVLNDKLFPLPNEQVSRNGWFWRGGIGKDFFHINFEKIFKNKNPGDEFPFKIILKYSFDNESEILQVLDYTVIAVKGKYISPWMGR